jgi:hypothetical protein
MGLLFAKLAASDARLVINYFFREVRIFECPKTKQTRLKLAVICAINVEFTITDHYQVRVGLINVYATNLATLS